MLPSSPIAVPLRSFYFGMYGAMGIYLPYFPTWLEARGISGLKMSLITALIPTLSVLAPSGFGMLADALGLRGSLLRAATLCACFAFGALALGSFLGAQVGFWAFFATVFAFAFFRTPMQLISDVIALEEPGDYGRVRMWGSIGFAGAALLAGRWIPLAPAWVLMAAITVPLFGAHLASWLLPERARLPSVPVISEARRQLSDPGYRSLLLTTVLGFGAHAAYELCISLHLRDLGASGATIGWAWAIATLSEVLLLSQSGQWLRRVRPRTLLLVSLGVCVVRWVFLGSVTTLWVVLLFQPLHAVTFGLRWVTSLALVKRFSSETTLATTQGLFLTASSLGTALGMLTFGTLYDELGGGAVYLSAAVVAALAVVSAVPLPRWQPVAELPH